MAEYIDREQVLSMSYCTNKPTWDNPHLDPKSVVDVDDIEALPLADVAPVIHGEWLGRHGYGGYDDYYCSICKMYEEGTRNPNLLGNYCPNCGAKMDKENNNNAE